MLRVLNPLGVQVLVQLPERERLTEGGIVIPDTAKQEYDRGTVIRAGPACREVATGDVVYFRKHSGVRVGEEGDRLRLMEEVEILAVGTDGKAEPPEEIRDWVRSFAPAITWSSVSA